ncbi:hypothetical protein H6778_02890 [Candidatus Nomurabacteria bacterium]|nr:hypothetical protein [Candidatus Nomurabacteria bacterium]
MVYGITGSLDDASDAALERMLRDLGRNGETTESASIRKRIETILRDRKQYGSSITENGRLHHTA